MFVVFVDFSLGFDETSNFIFMNDLWEIWISHFELTKLLSHFLLP